MVTKWTCLVRISLSLLINQSLEPIIHEKGVVCPKEAVAGCPEAMADRLWAFQSSFRRGVLEAVACHTGAIKGTEGLSFFCAFVVAPRKPIW